MKKHVLRAIGLSLVTFLLLVAMPAFADDQTLNLESRVVQTFDDPDSDPWFAIGSKFSTAGYPKTAYADTWPTALFGSNKSGETRKALGLAMLFDRTGYNWVDLIPGTKSSDGDGIKYVPKELPLDGRVSAIDMWIWSGNYDYYVEVYVRDYKGMVHVLNLGMLDHVGWKNFRVNIPSSISQSKKYLPKKESLKLVKPRVWTKPTEIVAAPVDRNAPAEDRAVYFYFDQIKILTDTFETMYDGDTLADGNARKDIWGSSGSGE